MDRREQDIQRAILEWLELQGIMAWRQNSGAAVARNADGSKRFIRFCSQAGISDIVGILPHSGRIIALEVKRPGGRVTPEQRRFLEQVGEMGGLAGVVRSVEDADRLLAASGWVSTVQLF